MRDSRGLNRADMIVLGAMFVIAGALVPALIAHARNLDNRSRCAANIRGILNSCAIYAAANNEAFPYIGGTSASTYDVTLKPDSKFATADGAIEGYYKDKQKSYHNNPYAALWILTLQGMSPKLFLCPDDPLAGKPAETTDKDNHWYMNVQEGKQASYSFTYMWQENKKGDIEPNEQWKNTTDSSLPIVSDMAPYMSPKAAAGEAATQAGTQPASRPTEQALVFDDRPGANLAWTRSANHKFAGMNVGFADVHVEWLTRADIGQANDNIWTMTVDKKDVPIEAGKLPAKFTWEQKQPYDTVMIPTRSAKGDLK